VVGRASDLRDGDRLLADVGGREVVIFRQQGKLYALANRCPHRGADLCKGRFLPQLTGGRTSEIVFHGNDTYLACPWHGWEFDLATGQSYFDPMGTRVRPYPVSVEDGEQIKVELDSGALAVTEHAEYTPAEWAAAGPRDLEGRQPGPYVADTFEVAVEGEFIVVSTRPVRPARAATASTEEKE
jgi:nitrite reductase/ring-hydroxylating ferredoxin subunit